MGSQIYHWNRGFIVCILLGNVSNNILLLQYQTDNSFKMNSRKLSLASIMESWSGEEIVLKANGYRLLLQSKKPKTKRNQHTNNYFSNFAHGADKFGYSRQNYETNYGYQDPGQFVIKAKSKNKSHRLSLADLGQANNTSRMVPAQKSRKLSQNYSQNNQNSQPNLFLNKLTQQNKQKTVNPYNYQTLDARTRNPMSQLPQNSHPHHPHHPLHSHSNPSFKHFQEQKICQIMERQKQDEQIQKIKESINGIKLPNNQSLCPEYANANLRFENMKKQILNKIIQSGEIDDVSEIVRELMQAADQIIARHLPSQPTLKKHIFSFKDNNNQFQQPHPQILHLTSAPNLLLLQPQQAQPQSQPLPQFKDDAGSISSISENGSNLENGQNGDKRNYSKDEDSCKIQNVFVKDLEINKNQSSFSSIKPIVLDDADKDSALESKIIEKVREEQYAAQLHEIQASMRVKNTIAQSKALQQPKIQHTIVKAQQSMSTFAKKQRALHAPTQPQPCYPLEQIPMQNTPGYQLQKLTLSPVKIVTNLQQAQEFDPSVVKFTELKAKYIETRTCAPQIIHVPSPLRFRRKEEVVKYMVANQIVDRESNSIEFFNQ